MKKIFFLTFVAITLPLVLLAFVGCMKKPEIKADYGPEIPITDIQKSIKDVAPPDIYSMRKGQYVSIDETQAIDVQIPITRAQRLDEITNFQDGTTTDGQPIGTLTFRVTLSELIDGKWNQSIQDNLNVSYLKNIATSAASTEVLARKLKENSGLSIQSLKKMDAVSPVKVTYHNLTQETGVMPVPAAVSKQADCGGLSDLACKNGLRYIQVKFDRVVWDSDTHGTKTSLTFIYSSDIPTYVYDWSNMNELEITNQIKTCAQVWVEVDTGQESKQTVPVLNCAEVRDFHFGEITP